jgi:hypothetical protein
MSAQETYLERIGDCIGDVSNSIDCIDTKSIEFSISELTNALKDTNKLLQVIADSNHAIAAHIYQYVANKV